MWPLVYNDPAYTIRAWTTSVNEYIVLPHIYPAAALNIFSLESMQVLQKPMCWPDDQLEYQNSIV